MDEGITPEQHADNVGRFAWLVEQNKARANSLAGRTMPMPPEFILLERLDLLIDSAFGAFDQEHPENTPPERMLFEVRWQERMAALQEQMLKAASAPRLHLPNGLRPDGLN